MSKFVIHALIFFTGLVVLTTGTARASGAAVRTGLYSRSKSITPADAYAWAPAANELIYATHDGSLWHIKGPSFAPANRLIKIALPPGGYQIEQIVWSPDGQNIAIVSPRSSESGDTIWLFDIKTLKLRDLLPSYPIDVRRVRFLRISAWLRDGRIMFFTGCGTGCQSLDAVQTRGSKRYWEFCYASGDFFWAPDQSIAVVQNEDSGVAPQGLGLVSVSAEVAVGEAGISYLPERQCKSSFEGTLPGEVLQFNSWLSNKIVLYSQINISSYGLNIWDIQSGSRKVLVADGSAGAVSPDGRYVSFIYHKAGVSQSTEQMSLRIMDLQSERVVASADIPPAVNLPTKWSPAGNYLAMFVSVSGNDSLLIARFESERVEVRQTEITGDNLSWSADGKYLAVGNIGYPDTKLTILNFPDANLSRSTPARNITR